MEGRPTLPVDSTLAAKRTPYETVKHIPNRYMGLPHRKALVSLCQMFGMTDNAIGVSTIGDGMAVGIDCTGALQDLLNN